MLVVATMSGHTLCVHIYCRYLVWIDGLSGNTSVMQMNTNTNEIRRYAADQDIVDLSIDMFDDSIFVITEEALLSLSPMSGHITPLFQFQTRKPIAIDLFYIHSYVLLDRGEVIRVNNQNTMECE